MNNSNKISIIIPANSSINALNIDLYLSTVIEQEYNDLELIVVDNNPHQIKLELSHKLIPNCKHIFQKYDDIYAAYNIGIGAAEGEFLAFIDAENLWLPDKLTVQMAAFENYAKLDGVFGYIREQTLAQSQQDLEIALEAKSPAINMPGHLPSTMLIRHESWKKVGKFTDNFFYWHREAVKSKLLLITLPIVVAKRHRELSRSPR